MKVFKAEIPPRLLQRVAGRLCPARAVASFEGGAYDSDLLTVGSADGVCGWLGASDTVDDNFLDILNGFLWPPLEYGY
ncbi:MAG: hypothetical protein NZV14_06130 [Bryobacteraceae bacterium]|nr:hypothetical protein [Bryobacteraceae bacterium]MDW8377719.1 hypothetical protein [Bryobacterales bacterium]